jgi:hypothetical protein
VMIMAPLPELDYDDVPFSLVADTLAQTESPQSKLNGAARSLSTWIEHSRALMIAGSVPSQSVNS